MQRYFLLISYDGTAYQGWQIQQNAITVQGVVDQALGVLLKSEVETVGCGRTDTGVHAKRFYLHFDASDPIEDTTRFLHSLNAIMPIDIAAYELIPLHPEAHARFDATARTYQYHVTSVKDPFSVNRSFFLPRNLDIGNMNSAAGLLKSHTEYGCFFKGRTDEHTTQCIVTHAEWKIEDGQTVFTITANRFLRNMVRAIVGTLIEVGENDLDMDGFISILHSGDRSEAGKSVPAHGLYLNDVRYPYISR
ncbi:MAG: tRNA pseudouridine synthase A [Bacteroidota bacterium]